ncbi:hypothetical protein sscle_10g075360 [Sclerotinia sclerotiorum 1980 UF-70]|uniref:HbrB-like protein n=1 Tax=Sclerotinia sclerotiorum (strain ATCC 18683 / 1980 / Ss-1) TaxID=665079 RepID=A0A1D9QCU0_SCLS1|nr:hypothetical protein sscle_10g075360 [Sclerotinia sclerotiorum 1980 UF-70]
MSQSTGPPVPRAPGSFSPIVQQASTTQRLPLRRVESSSSEDLPLPPSLSSKVRPQSQNAPAPPRPFYAQSTKSNSSTTSLQNFSRPTLAQVRTDIGGTPLRNASPLTPVASKSSFSDFKSHGRKHSQTQGSFEPYLPTAASSNFGNMSNLNTGVSASHIAAQAAMQHQSQHARQRSQTVPTPQLDTSSSSPESRRPSKGPISPPLLSLTEASAPRDPSFGGQGYHNGLLGGGSSAAQTAASVVFSKSPGSSPALTSTEYEQRNQAQAQAQAKAQAQTQLQAQAQPQMQVQTEKPAKTEKSKVKLFSRPGKIGISKDKEVKSGALPSPSALGSASMYSMANSSSATIRPIDTPQPEKEKDKEKHKHHFLSRQKHKLSSKDDHHLPLSSAASNSKPVDPNAPSSLYNFNLPPSPGPTSTSFAKSMSGLDLRHGGRALREKKKEEKNETLREGELSYQNSNEWPGPSSLGSAGAASYLGPGGVGYPSSTFGPDTSDLGKYGLNNMAADDAWPFLKAKLLVIFEGEDLRLCVEDLNRLVTTHIQRCIQKRCPSSIIDDLRELLETGFRSLDQTLRRTPDDRLIPHLVEMWIFTFTSVLPYMQAVFLPLDLEFSGHGPLMSPEAAREAWGTLPPSQPDSSPNVPKIRPLEVRKIVLIAYRDTVIIPRYEILKGLFSRLSLDSISLSIPNSDMRSLSPDSQGRPGTAISLDPSHGSYSSQNTTLLGGGSSAGDGPGSRSRAISNVSYGSEQSAGGGGGLGISGMPPPPRPFTPSSTHPAVGYGLSARERRQANVEDSSKKLTEAVGRMLQCMSVLSSVGIRAGNDSSQEKMEDLGRGLKLNWLGRGRTGRNRRGLVGGRVGQTVANL